MNFQILACFCLVISLANGLGVPSYLKPCSKTDPNFAKCALESGRAALPTIFDGDKKYGVPNLRPLTIPKLEIDAGSSLGKVTLSDLKIYGIEGVDLKKIDVNLDKNHASLTLFIPKIEVIGNYDVNGKLLILPIQGNGPINITAIDGTYVYTFDWIVTQKNGMEIADIKKDDLTHDIKRVHFKLENLFNGDEKLGQETNTFLNENWKDVYDDLGSAVSVTVSSVARSIASGYFSRIPFNELFLP